MDFLTNWRERVPTGARLLSILAIVVIVLMTVAYIVFIGLSILPQLRSRQDLASQLTSTERDLLEAQATPGGAVAALETQVASAQATLDAAASGFLSESEAADVLNGLYQYARESGVEIADLQSQPGSDGGGKGIYDARTFRLQVEGALPGLTDFVTRIRGASTKSLVINNMNIAEGEELSTLAMDITLYTSPYASGPGGPVTPGVTPPATPSTLTQLEEALAVAWSAEDWDQAIYLIDQILALDPGYDGMPEKLYSAHVNYGYQLLADGDSDGAIKHFSLALEINPGGEEALAGLQQASATPSPTLTAIEALAARLHDPWAAENWPEAISLIQQILALDPNYDDMAEKLYAAHVNHGYQLAAAGKLEEAKEAFSLALSIKPDGAEAVAGLRELAGDIPPTPQTPTATPTPPSEAVVHVVQRGDTLFSIARRYGTTVEAIKAANGLTSNNLRVGQQLRIPAGSTPPPDTQYTIYVVQAGDTLYSIARRFGTTVQAIKAANGLTSNSINPGQRLRIPQ